MNKEKKRILITGASGYVGSRLAPHLANNYESAAIVRTQSVDIPKKIKQYSCSLDFNEINKAFTDFRPDLVIHLATCYITAHSPDDINNIIDSNIKFGVMVAEAAFKNQCFNFLNIGTTWQNYTGAEYSPVNLYASSKEAFSDILKFYSGINKMNIINLKLPDSYGPNDKRKKIVNLLLESITLQKTLDLTGGEQYVNLVHISDIIDGIHLSVELLLGNHLPSKFNTYYLTSKNPMQIKKISELIEKVTQKKVLANWGKLPYRSFEFFTPIEFSPTLPGWSQKIELEQGISEIWSLTHDFKKN